MEGVGEEKEGCPTWGRALLSLLSMRMHERPHGRPQLEPDASMSALYHKHQGQLSIDQGPHAPSHRDTQLCLQSPGRWARSKDAPYLCICLRLVVVE
jgi:hypothetical protein